MTGLEPMTSPLMKGVLYHASYISISNQPYDPTANVRIEHDAEGKKT